MLTCHKKIDTHSSRKTFFPQEISIRPEGNSGTREKQTLLVSLYMGTMMKVDPYWSQTFCISLETEKG